MSVAAQPDNTAAARKAAIQKWRRRSQIVRFWRVALPALIVGVFVAIAGWGIARSLMPQAILAKLETDTIRMVGARLFGFDEHDRAFLLSALKAERDPKDEKRITLANPTFNLGAGKVHARQGIYVEGSTDIVLRGDVVIIDGKGGVVHTEEALINTRTGEVTNRRAPGAKAIQIESDMGKIAAEDYTIAKNGAVTFRGRVHGTINGKK